MPNISVKKLFIISGVLAALLAAVLGFLFYSSSSKDFIENNTGAVVIPTIHLSKTEKLESFSEKGVAFEYPEESVIETGSIEGGGDAVIIRPGITDVVNPIIEIQVTKAADTPIDRIHKIFSAYKFQKQDVLMGDGNEISATFYKGAIPLPGGNLQEEVVVFEKNGKVYKIQMSYSSNTVSEEASQAFQAVISTFKI